MSYLTSLRCQCGAQTRGQDRTKGNFTQLRTPHVSICTSNMVMLSYFHEMQVLHSTTQKWTRSSENCSTVSRSIGARLESAIRRQIDLGTVYGSTVSRSIGARLESAIRRRIGLWHVLTQAHSTMPLSSLQNKHCTSRGAVHQQMSVSIPGTACSRNYLVNYGHTHFYTPLFRGIADHLTNPDAHAMFAVQAAGSASTCHSPSAKCWLMQAQQTLMQVHQKDSGAVVGSRQTRPPVLSFVWQHGGPDHAPVHQRHKPPLQLRISTSDH